MGLYGLGIWATIYFQPFHIAGAKPMWLDIFTQLFLWFWFLWGEGGGSQALAKEFGKSYNHSSF